MREVPKPAQLVIAGAGREESQLRQLAIQFGIATRTRFLGFQSDVLPWMQAADAFVLASRWEGLPMSLLEASACGLPAVATDVPGSREIVVHGETGYLTPADDSLALRGAMMRMMHQAPESRTAMGDAARRRVLEWFSLDTVLDRWEEMYLELLERRPHPARWGHGTPSGDRQYRKHAISKPPTTESTRRRRNSTVRNTACSDVDEPDRLRPDETRLSIASNSACSTAGASGKAPDLGSTAHQKSCTRSLVCEVDATVRVGIKRGGDLREAGRTHHRWLCSESSPARRFRRKTDTRSRRSEVPCSVNHLRIES